MSSERILERLLALHPKSIDLSLERIERLLARLDHPERRLPPVVHVAGTNGKGSVVALLGAILEAAGVGVHRYVSPHLVRFHERIVLAGTPIEEASLAALLETCERANGAEPITFFEITTAAALLAFAAHPADVVVLETGLGGRLDATNVVARPRLVTITPIALDHQHYLGETIAQIAAEKAAIIKAGVPAVIASQPEAARAVIEAHAHAVDAPLIAQGAAFEVTASGPDGMHYRDLALAQDLFLPGPALAGRHQIDNAAIAIASALRLGIGHIDAGAIAAGLRSVRWPGRLQPIGAGPYVAALGAGWSLWLDGAHNPAAAAALAAWVRVQTRPVHLIMGMLETKDADGFIAALAPSVASLQAIPIPKVAAALAPNDIAARATAHGLVARTAPDLSRALAHLGDQAPGIALIAGSLYLAGAVLSGRA